jgi:hypothetical protein
VPLLLASMLQTRCWHSGASSRDVHWEQCVQGLCQADLRSGKWGVGGGRSEGWIPRCWPLKRHARPPRRLPPLHARSSCLVAAVARSPPGLPTALACALRICHRRREKWGLVHHKRKEKRRGTRIRNGRERE